MKTYDIYKDIAMRTNGAIYLGIVGPVRTGKSTFIKRFVEELVLPNMEEGSEKEQLIDELPQSGNGKTIMTTEPKFVPGTPAKITLEDGTKCNIRLIDCVGFMTEGALGYLEEDSNRMVKTPWSEEEIPFTEAAEIGTEKVIREHSTIGIVVSTDGSFGELTRKQFTTAEEQTITELKQIGKPFIMILNSAKPHSKETKDLARELEIKYDVSVCPVNCLQLRKEDITYLMETALASFPLVQAEFYMPKWVELLDKSHPLKQTIFKKIREMMHHVCRMKDIPKEIPLDNNEYLEAIRFLRMNPEKGSVQLQLNVYDRHYFEMLGSILKMEISDEMDFMEALRTIASEKSEYHAIGTAWKVLKEYGYSIVEPNLSELTISEPELTKHGSKYGVRLKASAPSVHFIKANVETEISPIVGTQEQARDLMEYMKQQEKNGIQELLGINIFGKTVSKLIEEGLSGKTRKISEESKGRLQDALQKIMNESAGNVICIIF